MKYPNALAGVKKLYTAEIIALIGAICGLVMTCTASAGASGGAETISVTLLAVTGGMLIAMSALLAISFIMGIVGLNKGKADEVNFKYALIYTFACIAAAVLQGIVKSGSLLYSVCEAVISAGSIMINWYVCTAIIKLAGNLGDGVMAAKGFVVRKLLAFVWGANFVLDLIGSILSRKGGVGIFAVITMIFAVTAAVTEVVAYVLYLKFLSNSRKMLEA